jgi:hypothetical protein
MTVEEETVEEEADEGAEEDTEGIGGEVEPSCHSGNYYIFFAVWLKRL